MKKTISLCLLIASIFTMQANDKREMRSLISGNNAASSGTTTQSREGFSECWCNIPCWGKSCQKSCPQSCLTKHNKKQKEEFRKAFPKDGPWDKKGNSMKKCYVDCMKKTTPYNWTILTAIPAAVVALNVATALLGACGVDAGIICCGLPPENACINCLVPLACPFPNDHNPEFCCNKNTLFWLSEAACIASPFATVGLEYCAANYLANPDNWEGYTPSSDSFEMKESDDEL